MSGKTAGQQAYETMHASREQRDQSGSHIPWLELDESMPGDFGALKREDMEAAAAAVETDQVRLAREDRDQLRKQVLDLAAALEAEGREEIAIARTRDVPRFQIGKNRGRVFNLCATRLRHAAGPPS
jgi:hypothetical protein